jgi:hypothetical protein
VLGKTTTPGYADFQSACLLNVATLSRLSAVPATCVVN